VIFIVTSLLAPTGFSARASGPGNQGFLRYLLHFGMVEGRQMARSRIKWSPTSQVAVQEERVDCRVSQGFVLDMDAIG